MTQTVRHRILDTHDYNYAFWYEALGNPYYGYTSERYSIFSHQYTVSEGHGWPKGRSVRDVGGPFETFLLKFSNSHPGTHQMHFPVSVFPGHGVGSSFPRVYSPVDRSTNFKPFFVPEPTLQDYKNWVPASSDTLLVPGTKFIADTIPTNPMLDASVSLAELYREGLPKLFGATLLRDKANFFRSLGGEYLNYQFGWKPLVSDIRDAAKAIMDQESILLQLQRDSGRNVHRKRSLPAVVTDNQIVYGTQYPHGMGTWPYSTARYRASQINSREQWFSGCYTFYFEPSKMAEVSRIATEARHLYGLELTPEVLWNLAPWSWLVDWITNVGTVLHNVSAFQQDGLVLRYGYVMEQNSKKWRGGTDVTWNPSVSGSYPSQPFHEFSAVRKMRRKATPFGFGLLESSFSVRQWAILAALGITRAPKSLSP